MQSIARESDRMLEVSSWLQGEPSQCLLLLPQGFHHPRAFARALGLADAEVVQLEGDTIRPCFEPHPTVARCLSRENLLDVVIVVDSGMPHFDGRGRRRRALASLEEQLDRLAGYRSTLGGPRLRPDTRLHGWLWDSQQGMLLPYDSNEGELDQRSRIELSPQELETPPRSWPVSHEQVSQRL